MHAINSLSSSYENINLNLLKSNLLPMKNTKII